MNTDNQTTTIKKTPGRPKGKKQTEEAKRKLSQYQMEHNLFRKKCVVRGKQYDSQVEAARALQVHPSTICKWIKSNKHLDCYQV